MTFSAKIKIQYDSEWTNTSSYYSSYQDDMLPEEHITMEIPAEDLSTIQLFKFFSNFLRAIGHNDMGIMKGACATAFNESQKEEDMRKVADEFELKMAEDYAKEFRKLQDEIYDLKAKLSRLKAKLSRCQQPDNPNYTDEEMEAMTAENQVTAQTLKNAQVVCHDCGDKYGTYSVGCSSTWEGKCGVCGETKGVTEVRDYAYLTKGIKELSEKI
jgi:hypothetical protein